MGLQCERDIAEGEEHVFRSGTAARADTRRGLTGRQGSKLQSVPHSTSKTTQKKKKKKKKRQS